MTKRILILIVAAALALTVAGQAFAQGQNENDRRSSSEKNAVAIQVKGALPDCPSERTRRLRGVHTRRPAELECAWV